MKQAKAIIYSSLLISVFFYLVSCTHKKHSAKSMADTDRIVGEMAIQPDGKIIITGFFDFYRGIPRHNIARLNPDGTLDMGFKPVLFSGTTFSMLLQPDGKIIVGGQYFELKNGNGNDNLFRLNPDGSLDSSFVPDLRINGTVRSISMQPNGKIVVGGIYYNNNGTASSGVARLHNNGSLDTSFEPGKGADDYVYNTTIQPDGKILVVGKFDHFDGVAASKITRLNRDGSIDTSFHSGKGVDCVVFNAVLQPDNKIIVSGCFSSYNDTDMNGIVRLHPDGSIDKSFNPGTGLVLSSLPFQDNNTIYSTKLQSDGKILIGGGFDIFNGVKRSCIARLNPDGSIDRNFNLKLELYKVYSITVQPDGKIMASTYYNRADNLGKRYLSRLNSNGSLDPDFVPDVKDMSAQR